MTHRILSVLFFLLAAGSIQANKIDDLKTVEEAKKFIQTTFPGFENFSLGEPDAIFHNKAEKRIADSLKIKYWDKADFDGNGMTDLMAYGALGDGQLVIILSMAGDKYIMKKIHRGFIPNTNLYPIVVTSGKQALLKLYKTPSKESYIRNKGDVKTPALSVSLDTLVCKFGSFIEYNGSPKKYKVDNVQFSSGKCFGSCPVFSLAIKGSGDAEYTAEAYNKLKGNFKTKIGKVYMDSLVEMLAYINLDKLSNKYEVGWTDDQSVTLKVNYNGLNKQIDDYGLMGSYGLTRLYRFLFDLRENQVWK